MENMIELAILFAILLAAPWVIGGYIRRKPRRCLTAYDVEILFGDHFRERRKKNVGLQGQGLTPGRGDVLLSRKGNEMNTTPQTVDFELRLQYLQVERPAELETVKFFEFDSFDKMIEFAYAERRRRRRIDRATRADYEVRLTAHGREVCEADERRKASHEEMLNKYHKIY